MSVSFKYEKKKSTEKIKPREKGKISIYIYILKPKKNIYNSFYILPDFFFLQISFGGVL